MTYNLEYRVFFSAYNVLLLCKSACMKWSLYCCLATSNKPVYFHFHRILKYLGKLLGEPSRVSLALSFGKVQALCGATTLGSEAPRPTRITWPLDENTKFLCFVDRGISLDTFESPLWMIEHLRGLVILWWQVTGTIKSVRSQSILDLAKYIENTINVNILNKFIIILYCMINLVILIWYCKY